jgi:hypothetical protein
MPIARASLAWRMACVTMLTGLVKLMSQADGVRRAMSRAYSTIAGIVRSAIAKPAAPTVS